VAGRVRGSSWNKRVLRLVATVYAFMVSVTLREVVF
jgi:hypothetical protein